MKKPRNAQISLDQGLRMILTWVVNKHLQVHCSFKDESCIKIKNCDFGCFLNGKTPPENHSEDFFDFELVQIVEEF